MNFSDDAFGVNRLAATEIVRHLLEAWTPERKDEIIKSMRARGGELVEHVTLGDYDLTLWHYQQLGHYAVAINSGQEDPTSLEGQRRRPKAQAMHWQEVVSTLRDWSKKYGRLLVGSTRPDRIAAYRRLLSRYFLIGIWADYPSAGFFILPD